MLEILAIIWFGKSLSATAKSKGRSGYWGALALFWFVGEVVGFVVAGAIGLVGLVAYPIALLGGGVGVLAAWLLVRSLGSRTLEGDGSDNPHYDPKNPFSPPQKS